MEELMILILEALAKIGKTGEAAGIVTVFQNFAKVNAALGAVADAANPAGSIFARLADVEAKLGAINPTTDGTDTLFKYLHQLASTIAVNTGGRTFTTGAFSTALNSLQTALDLTGKGNIAFIGMITPLGLTASNEIKITLDGKVIANVSGLLANTTYALTCASNNVQVDFISGTPNYWNTPLLEFNTSLKIEIKSDGTRILPINWGYNI